MGGYELGVQQAKEGHARKMAYEHEARQEKIKLRDQLATKISSLEEGTPEHKQAKDLLVQVDTDLMDPNHPMPIEKIKNLLMGHFGHKQPAQPAPSVTTQVGGVSTPSMSSGPSIPSAESLLSVPALGQAAPTPITIPEPATEAPAAPTEAAQPPARDYASPDDTSGIVDPRQFRPSTPMLRRAFPAKPGFHLVTNPMEGQKAYYQSDTDPSDIREAKTGLKKKAVATSPIAAEQLPLAPQEPTEPTPSTPTTLQGQPVPEAPVQAATEPPVAPSPAVVPVTAAPVAPIPAPALPARKLSPKQQKAQSQAEQQAQLEIAAAGLTPEEKGIAQARADAAGNLFAFQANSKLYEMMYPRPTDPAEIPEWEKGKRAYQNELLQGMMV